MEKTLNRREIAKSVFLSKITDGRFKQNRVSVCLLAQLSEQTASANAVVPKILTHSSADYPDLRLLNNRLSALYAARLSETAGGIGDTQYADISVKSIDNGYALDKEDVLGEGIDILLGCLFNPLTENGGFKESVTELEKQSLIDQIEAELNEKRVYAMNRATELLCEGEPAATHYAGTVEGVKAVTAQSAFAAYKKLLETARIEIICVGRSDFAEAEKKFAEAFGKINRENIEDCHSAYSPLKAESLTHTERMDVSQSKMVMGFKTADGNIDALTIMAKIYGGSATSKLFTNVRERLSLCYYCWAKFNPAKGIMLCESGVESENLEKAQNEITAQLKMMKKGEFTEEEILHAKLSVENDLKSVNDSLSGIKRWYLTHIYRCDIITPEQAIERYLKVTREEIIKAAESMNLDTVYILTGNRENEN